MPAEAGIQFAPWIAAFAGMKTVNSAYATISPSQPALLK
jgi:hypothetical protein